MARVEGNKTLNLFPSAVIIDSVSVVGEVQKETSYEKSVRPARV